MALPIIRSVSDCVNFEKTVTPFIPQLYDLPEQILQSITNPTGLVNLYTSTNPLISGFALSLFLSPIFLVVSEINRNYSQVDRCWSLLPTVYNAHYALYAHLTGLPTGRLDALLGASVCWSVSKLLPSHIGLLAETYRHASHSIIGGREVTKKASKIIDGRSSRSLSRVRFGSCSTSLSFPWPKV